MGTKSIPGEYTFDLKAQYSKGGLQFSTRNNQETKKSITVLVKEKPIAEVVNFEVINKKYTRGEKILFNWKIKNPLLLETVNISGKTGDGKVVKPIPLSLAEFQGNCKQVKNEQALECNNIPLPASEVGNLTYTITAFSKEIKDRNSSKEAGNAVEVLPQVFGIKTFTINGSRGPNIEVEEGKTINLVWDVRGNKNDIRINIIGLQSDLPLNGKRSFQIFQSTQYKLEVVDRFGKLDTEFKEINVRVKPKPIPTPTVTITAPPPTLNNPENNSRERRNAPIPFPGF